MRIRYSVPTMHSKALIVGAALLLVSSSAADARLQRGIDPREFVPHVTNPWFPLEPGTTYIYKGVKDMKQTRDVVTVTYRTRKIAGVRATEVRDLLYEAGHLEERTSDWYAQDKRGNVWYFGESTAELDVRGHVTSREGSWLTGIHGARAGIYIPGHPRIGESARQEYYKGHAEDHFQVLNLHATVTVPYISSHKALLTKEWTPLEPGAIDHKYYVRGIGTVQEIAVAGPKETNILVKVKAGHHATTAAVTR
jgi:hypothetical protein